MTNKFKSAKKIVFAVLFFFCLAPFRTDAQEQVPRMVRLTWPGDENALRYEMLIEREENGRYIELHRESTEATSVVLSLFSGSYQYSVIPYDLLNRPGGRTEWKPFRVPAARTSSPGIFSPDDLETNIEHDPNPLETNLEDIISANNESGKKVPSKKYTDFILGASYIVLYPVYGDLEFSFVGLKFKIDTIPIVSVPLKSAFFNIRTEIAASWFYFGNPFSDDKDTSQMMIFEPSLLFQIQFSRILFSPLMVGIGLSMLSGKLAEEQNGITAQMNVGFSFLLLLAQHSYFEFGVDFSHLFEWSTGSIRPWLGFGVRF